MLQRKRVVVSLMVIVAGLFIFSGLALADDAAKININTATVAELTTLKGIGDAYAQRIVEYREANGPFTSIEQIKEVKGIGEKTFESIKDQITVGETGE